MEARWHTTESRLTELYGAQDWKGVLQIEKDAVLAARAVHPDWPEVAYGIYSMLSDTHSELGDPNKVLELQGFTLQMAREVGNREMEATTLVDMADFNHASIKNNAKALDLLQASLPLWEHLDNGVALFKCHTSLGQLYAIRKEYASAIRHYQSSLHHARALENQSWQAQVLYEMRSCHAKMQNFERALEGQDKSKQIAREKMLQDTSPTSTTTKLGRFFGDRAHAHGRV
jgi:tetratricopeptide (TPR) repeat protein